ncbi:MAG: winged helix-turn-helix transcriptional regulator [Rhodospirillaceae bacterium]|nr:winged helix-turn-helix transcriptional regulator [Rhodospirillaceae bacterium]
MGHIEACELLKAMSNETRLMILCRLLDGEKTVGELESVTSISQSAISQHLAVLRGHNLVSTRREGQSIIYALTGDKPLAIIKVLHRIYSGTCD